MWQYNHTEELYHYGVPGMRWGVRRKKQESTASDESKRVKEIRKKKVNEMTNKELKEANERLNLESNYARLTQKKNHVKSFVKGFIATAGMVSGVVAAAKVFDKNLIKPILTKIGDVLQA